ncbi:MAG: Stp1/IreP family PP2C-type Ser/Thr phosphatase [Acidimicrobiia bacterium]|nr:Stp1/IreP family PP2C-type Ser/Thr phosphatase [Acidimicrobiia bacterium]
MRLTARGATDVGRVREENEDGFLVDERVGLYAVADGMGGHRAGEVASATALEALRASVAAGSAVRDAVLAANAAVHEKAAGDAELAGMGTTLTAATLAAGGTLLVAHVGDSRAYVLRDGELRQVTVDHSLVEELVREGRLTPEQATVHPHRSIITRALGVDAEVEVDLYSVELRPGDRVLLCSDGLTSMVRPDGVATVLRREDDAERAARALVDTANAAGGEDNITVVVVDVEDGDDPRRWQHDLPGSRSSPRPPRPPPRRLLLSAGA